MSDETLPPPQADLLLATRCFGRATPFPDVLFAMVLHKLEEPTPYAEVKADMLRRKLVLRAGRGAVDLAPAGKDWLRFAPQTPTPIWQAAVEAALLAVGLSIEAKDRDALDLLEIHTAGLANSFYSRFPEQYVQLMGLSMLCLRELGRDEEAARRWADIQAVLNRIHQGE